MSEENNFLGGKDDKPKRSFLSHVKRFFLKVFGFALLAYVLFSMFVYFMSYSDGWRSGTLTKFSRKGYIFKTWEGEIYQRGAEDASLNIMNKAWNFSVESKQDIVIKELETYIGEEFRLHYYKRYGHLFWLGDTDYFVDSVVSVKR